MATEKVVIIIPTYNEKGNVERLIEVLEKDIFPAIVPKFIMSILVVDDSSPDGTGQAVTHLQKKYPNIHLLTNHKKAGLGNAYTKGMCHAVDRLEADIIFEFDADFSHDPKKIYPMLKRMDQGFDMVVGSRYIKGGSIPQNWGLHRKFLSVIGNLVARTLIGDFEIHDWTGGFRAIRRHVIETILPHLNRDELMGYTFQIGFLLQARRQGYTISEVPFHFKDRTLGKSKMPPEYIKKTLWYIFRVRTKEIVKHRLFKFAMVGVIGAVVQLSSIQLFRNWFPYQLSYFFSVELAVISNFIWSNVWTFSDISLAWDQIPIKFLQFNAGSAGSIIIQQGLAYVVENYIGLIPLFTLPITHTVIDTGWTAAVVGIFMGMFWNYFIYSKIIWKTKPEIIT